MQIVLKVNRNSNKSKIPYIVDTDYKKRNCYARNLNYFKFEEKVLEIVREICQKYANRKMLEEVYLSKIDKLTESTCSLEKEIEDINLKIANINRKLDRLYEDKLNEILLESDFERISKKFINERNLIEGEKSQLEDKYILLKKKKISNNGNNIQNMNKTISEFLEMKQIDKLCLYRLIDKIEIDNEKNVFVSFNFAPLDLGYNSQIL